MNEQAKEIIAQMLQRALDGVDTAADFAAQEIPEVVDQLLMWHAVESLVGMSIAIMMNVALIPAWKKGIPFIKNYSQDDTDRIFIAIMGCAVSAVVLLVSTIPFSLTWLKIWIAPKLYLLEYGASLIK